MLSKITTAASLVLGAAALFALSPTAASAQSACVRITGNLYNCATDPSAAPAATLAPAAPTGAARLIQVSSYADTFDFYVINANGRKERIYASTQRGMIGSTKVRICITNMTKGYREINFKAYGVNPFKMKGYHDRACATFPAGTVLNQTGNMSAIAGNRPARVYLRQYPLQPYAGAIINMVWKGYQP